MHISDGILAGSTSAAGFVAAGGLVAIGLARSRETDMAKAGLLTASFFLASLVRIPLPGTSVHLLLASLNGIALGTLCFPSIFIALLLQALLFGHGGVSSLGVNTVIMALPAYLAGVAFRAGLRRSMSGWTPFIVSLAASFILAAKLSFDALFSAGLIESSLPWIFAVPSGAAAALLASLTFKYAVPSTPEHRWGFAMGSLAVLGSASLFYLVLAFAPLSDYAAREGFKELARFAFVSHVPIIIAEGAIVAMLIKYLAAVSPELLGTSGKNGRADAEGQGSFEARESAK